MLIMLHYCTLIVKNTNNWLDVLYFRIILIFDPPVPVFQMNTHWGGPGGLPVEPPDGPLAILLKDNKRGVKAINNNQVTGTNKRG